MNLELPEKEEVPKKRIAIYITVLIICILAIIIVVGVQILGNDIVDNMFGVSKITKRTEQEESELKANFESLFQNNLDGKLDYEVPKINLNENIVYTYYKKKESTNNYELNVNLPLINIDNNEIQNFNKEITDTFENKAEEIITLNDNSVYSVKYLAHIDNNILSVVLYSDLKQGTDAQRVIIETFNYNLKQNKKMNLDELLNNYKLSKNEVQNKINNDISKEEKKSEELKKLGYNISSRDINSDIYKIENLESYFIYNGNIYIIFAYGNNQITSEIDIVIV